MTLYIEISLLICYAMQLFKQTKHVKFQSLKFMTAPGTLMSGERLRY